MAARKNKDKAPRAVRSKRAPAEAAQPDDAPSTPDAPAPPPPPPEETRPMAARKRAAKIAGEALTDDEIEEGAQAAGDAERKNPLSHPDKGEVERAALAAENQFRVAHRRPA